MSSDDLSQQKRMTIKHLGSLELRPNTAHAHEVVPKRMKRNSMERTSNNTYSATDEDDEDFLSSDTDEDLRI
jgi:hypothetical protein